MKATVLFKNRPNVGYTVGTCCPALRVRSPGSTGWEDEAEAIYDFWVCAEELKTSNYRGEGETEREYADLFIGVIKHGS